MDRGRIGPLLHDVAYADTDAGGIVYHARYVEMAERSRNHLLKALGLPVADMKARFGVLLIVREVRAVHHRPAFVGDTLALDSGLVGVNGVRATWRTRIQRDADLVCDVEAQVAAFDPAAAGPCLLPEDLMAFLAGAPRMPAVRRQPALRLQTAS